jgi:hypothetical protein
MKSETAGSNRSHTVVNALTNRTLFVALVIVLEAAGNARAQYQPTWESLKTIPVPEWGLVRLVCSNDRAHSATISCSLSR